MNMLNTIQYNLLIPISVYFSLAGISPLELNRFSKYQNNEAGIIAENAKPTLVSNQFKFTEGPAVDKKGNVFFTDQPNIVPIKNYRYS
jgi:gluconolactonase